MLELVVDGWVWTYVGEFVGDAVGCKVSLVRWRVVPLKVSVVVWMGVANTEGSLRYTTRSLRGVETFGTSAIVVRVTIAGVLCCTVPVFRLIVISLSQWVCREPLVGKLRSWCEYP
jgi:hypothetical protein